MLFYDKKKKKIGVHLKKKKINSPHGIDLKIPRQNPKETALISISDPFWVINSLFTLLRGSLYALMQLQFLLNEFLITSASKVERLQSKCPYAFSTKLHLSFIFQSFLPLWRISEACDATPDYVVSQLSRRLCLQRRLCTRIAATATRSTQTHEAKCTTKGGHMIAGFFSPLG